MIKKAKQLVHLHTHTEYSVFDGCGKQEDFIKKAQKLGMPAIALTEHGSMRGVYKQNESCRELSKDLTDGLFPIKPIFGIEFYLCDDLYRRGLSDEETAALVKDTPRAGRSELIYQEEVRQGIRDRFHLTALAMDNVGLRNLYKLSSLAWIDGYWKRPRIDLKTLFKYHEGIIILSGCLSGAINHYILRGDAPKAIEQAESIKEVFGDRFYLELMAHSVKDQDKANKGLLMMSTALDIPIVSTQDAHWIDDEDAPVQEVLLCIHTKKVLSMPTDGDIKTGRFKFDTDEFWFKSREETEETYRVNHGYMSDAVVKRALDATLEINERITAELKIDRKQGMVPKIPMPPEFSGVTEDGEPDPEEEFKYMVQLCIDGWHNRGLEGRIAQYAKRHKKPLAEVEKMYKDRLKHELTAIKRQKAVRYFLVIWRMYNWARTQGIECGPGRGSAGGVLVSFLMYITDIDPLEYGLLFERFLSPERVDLPDVDCDFESERREEVIAYLRETYGADNTCQIATIGTLKGKQCLIDIARVLEIPDKEVREVTASIVERSSGDERASQTIEDAFKDFDVCRKFNAKYPQVLQLAKKLEGQARNLGIHAAGVIVSPVPITDVAPVETRKIDERRMGGIPSVKVSAFDMYGSAAVGLMKIDILGIRNLDTIRSCREMILKRHGVVVDWDHIDMNDARVLQNFTEHSYIGIFQFDTPAADKISEGVTFDNFEDVAAMIALDRPGTARSGLATEYLKRKQNPKARKSIHPIVDAICADTLGVIVYQEHVTRIFVELAGFSPATADSLRKKIAKKWGDEAIGKERENFVKGAVARGCSKELAEDLISKITFFGSYGFNKSHSIAYGLTGYRQMWLKTYYPTEYMWALLKHEPDRAEVSRFVKECHRLAVPVKPAEINHSSAEWTINEDGEIIASLVDLKGVAENSVKEIESKRPFRNFIDFARRIDRRRVNRAHLQVLFKSGAMRAMVPNQKWALENAQLLWDLTSKGRYVEAVEKLVASLDEPDWTPDEAQIIASEVNPLSFGKHPMEPYKDLLENVCQVPWLSMAAEDLYDAGNGWVNGIVLEVKYNQIGDFHTGADPTEDEKRRQKWGARYANINVEDISGKQNRMKVDHDIFDTYRPIVDKKQGTVVASHVNLGSKWKNMRAHFLVDLEALRLKVNGFKLPSEDLRRAVLAETTGVVEHFTWEERILIGAHPAARFGARREDLKSGSGRIRVTGVVTHLNVKLDKKYNEMAFFGVHHASGYVDVMCFASAWPTFKEMIKPGRALRAVFKPTDRGDGFILDNDVDPAVKLLE